jgi:CPA1 family monovalent cation:H+ antiporter
VITDVDETEFCDHLAVAGEPDAPLAVCSSCVEIGGEWEHLRQCLSCGRTSCCNLSPNRHATAHFHESGHPMIRSAEPGEDWRWCYLDDRLYMADGAREEIAEA